METKQQQQEQEQELEQDQQMNSFDQNDADMAEHLMSTVDEINKAHREL